MDTALALSLLGEVLEFDGDLRAEDTLHDIGVDSLSALEWLYLLDEELRLHLDLDDDRTYDGLMTLPLRVYLAHLDRCASEAHGSC
jgi:acyl carrier protein